MSLIQDDVNRTSDDLFGFAPREWQKEAAVQALEGRDVVVHAGTGYGKTMAFFLPIALRPEKTAVVISPLKALQAEQVKNLEAAGINACAVNETTINNALIHDIEKGAYRAVFLGPEMLFSPHNGLRNLWHRAHFRDRLFLVVVDEAHCVVEWGNSFRRAYSSIGDFRTWIPQKVAFMALSSSSMVASCK